MSAKIIAIIPARYASTRFPGKPLALINGKPMIQWVYERTVKAHSVNDAIVATDDERIYNAVKSFGRAEMTPKECATGSDRIAKVAEHIDADVVINVQGDEPLIDPQAVDLVADVLLSDENAEMATLVRKVQDPTDLTDPNHVRVVMDRNYRAMYFSRAVIPYARDVKDQSEWMMHYPYYLHIGIYAYRRQFLLKYESLPYSILEQVEKLEQLRALENGVTIKVGICDYQPMCVDVKEDIPKVEQRLRKLAKQ